MGDIVGNPGRSFLRDSLSRIRQEAGIAFVVANAENAAAGSGITMSTANEIFDAGVDVMTTGDHIFKKPEGVDVVEQMSVLRPLNWSKAAPGRGYLIKEVDGHKIAVINLLGRVFLQPANCPFEAVAQVIESVRRSAAIVIVDMHAEATSEKLAMGHFLAGKVTAVLGTHTHIPTADERIIRDHTAYITDVGMTGSCDSILGREKADIIQRFTTNMPVKFNLAQGDVRLQGVILDVDPKDGRALDIKRVEYKRNG